MSDAQIIDSRSMTMASIESLPVEILAEIFAYLSGSELKSAMLTNQIFADIVSSSTKLMKKFFIVITKKRKWDFVTLSSLKRKHQSLVFFDFENSLDDVLLRGLENVGVNLKNIEFNDCRLNADDFVKILMCSIHIKHLKIFHTKINNYLSGNEMNLYMPNLKTLKIKQSEINFELFSSIDSLTKVQLEVDETCNVDLRSFQLVLVKQFNLKLLSLINLRLSNLFDQKMIYSFQLESLKIIQCHFKHKENFEIFLDSQKLLREVELSFSHMKLGNDRVRYFESVVESILKKQNLKYFTLNIEEYSFCSFNFMEVNKIENLNLRLKDTNFSSAQFLKYFPSMLSLELDVKELTNDNVDALNNSSLTHLKIYNLTSECFRKLKIKSLKSLHIHETAISECDWEMFIDSNPQIVKLVINFSLLMDFDVKLLEKIIKKLKNLEHIELTDKYLGFDNEIYEIIVENCKNLAYIKLWNINIEKDFEEKDKEYLRRRNIKFDLFNDESLNKPMVPF